MTCRVPAKAVADLLACQPRLAAIVQDRVFVDNPDNGFTLHYGLWPERYLLLEGSKVLWASSLAFEAQWGGRSSELHIRIPRRPPSPPTKAVHMTYERGVGMPCFSVCIRYLLSTSHDIQGLSCHTTPWTAKLGGMLFANMAGMGGCHCLSPLGRRENDLGPPWEKHIYIHIYIYVCAVIFLSGRSLGVLIVIIWAKLIVINWAKFMFTDFYDGFSRILDTQLSIWLLLDFIRYASVIQN